MSRISKEKIEKIVEMRKKGHGYRSIAREAGVSLDTAHRHGKGVEMEEDKRYGRGKSVKELVKKESTKLVGLEHIKPSHRDKFDQLISKNVDNAIKGLAQAFGFGSRPFVGLFGAGRSIANIAFEAEESERYTVLPVIKNFLFGEQKLPALPLRRKVFARRLAAGIVFFNRDKIKNMLKEEET